MVYTVSFLQSMTKTSSELFGNPMILSPAASPPCRGTSYWEPPHLGLYIPVLFQTSKLKLTCHFHFPAGSGSFVPCKTSTESLVGSIFNTPSALWGIPIEERMERVNKTRDKFSTEMSTVTAVATRPFEFGLIVVTYHIYNHRSQQCHQTICTSRQTRDRENKLHQCVD